MMEGMIGAARFAAGVTLSLAFGLIELLCLPIRRKSGIVFHALARAWAHAIIFLCGSPVTVRGIEKLDRSRNYVYVANHASMFDIPAIIASVPDQIRIVYKKELEWIPLFGWGLKWGNYIGIDRGLGPEALRSIDEAVRTIHNGASVLLYAEGTRTKDGKLQPFKRGAFNLAARSGIPVVPLTINGTFNILPKGSMVVKPHPVEIVLDDPIPIGGEGKPAEMKLMDLVHRAIQNNYVDQSGS
jgi:1-acyl-sn-glycerol-3-phosphate acyltransferase